MATFCVMCGRIDEVETVVCQTTALCCPLLHDCRREELSVAWDQVRQAESRYVSRRSDRDLIALHADHYRNLQRLI